jgi:nucleotidyltransferase substrate binding protein (TIGR01987 family)
MKLDLTPLQKALTSLQEAIDSTTDELFMNGLSESQQRTMRAGVIQNFEFTYEISWKMLRRQLKSEEGEEDVARLSRKDLYRLAAQKGLLDDPESWFVFHRARNETSHTYDQSIANDVYLIVLKFLPSAQALFNQIESR